MKRASVASAVVVLTFGSTLAFFAPACGTSSSHGTGDSDASSSGGASSSGTVFSSGGGTSGSGSSSGPSGPCTGLQCQINLSCGPLVNNGLNTSISGYVYDPAGHDPLNNVVVYIPNAPLDPLPASPAGDCSCSALFSGNPIAAAVTDAKGHFTIPNAPDNTASPGTPIPLVVQIGKWRKQTSIASVSICADNTSGVEKLTLPSKASATDDLPQIAISTGGADSLECLLLRIGVSPDEYTRGPGGTGHIHIFKGSYVPGETPPAPEMSTTGGATPSALGNLFDSASDLSPYDILMLSCEGAESTGIASTDGGATGLTATQLAALASYTGAGGRAFLSHFHYAWLTSGPFSSANPPLATWTPGSNPVYEKVVSNGTNTTNGAIVTTLFDGSPFVKGEVFDEWLDNVGALTNGALPIAAPRYNSEVDAVNTSSQQWITTDDQAIAQLSDGTTLGVAGTSQYFTFNTPIGGVGVDDAGATEYCGRVVYSDLHVGGASGDYPGTIGSTTVQPVVPDQCATGILSAQEKALEFMLFDLSSCVTPDTGPGAGGPPVIIH